MSDDARLTRAIRSRPTWYWVYIGVGFLVMLALMFVAADRVTAPSGESSFESIAPSETVEPVNDFIPAARPISECISAIPKPGCGSEARGGWHQWLVLLAILVGLAVIVWRVVASARTARLNRSQGGTIARGGPGGDPPP